jgi:transposase
MHNNKRAAIIRWRQHGWRVSVIAENFGVSEATVRTIVNGTKPKKPPTARKRPCTQKTESQSAIFSSARSYLRKAFSQGF